MAYSLSKDAHAFHAFTSPWWKPSQLYDIDIGIYVGSRERYRHGGSNRIEEEGVFEVCQTILERDCLEVAVGDEACLDASSPSH